MCPILGAIRVGRPVVVKTARLAIRIIDLMQAVSKHIEAFCMGLSKLYL